MKTKHKQIVQMSLEELEKLSTKQILARLKRLQHCEQSATRSDQSGEYESSAIIFKDTVQWITAYEQVKAVLAQREHIAKGAALIEKRQSRARTNHTLERRAGKRKPS